MFGDGGPADLVDKALECRRRVAQAEVHYSGFMRPAPCFEGGLVLVAFLHVNVVVPLSNV